MYNLTTSPQNQKILKALRSKGNITTSQAARLGIARLSARICELRDAGYKIVTELPTAKRPSTKYVLER